MILFFLKQQESDNSAVRTVAWQQTLLFMLIVGLFSGSKKDLERTQANACQPITVGHTFFFFSFSSFFLFF